jgi:hypothetical protein
VVDINGPLHIDNGDVNIVTISDFEIISMDSKQNFSIAVGSSYDVSSSLYTNVILLSNDYGSSWKKVDLSGNVIIVGGGSNLNDIESANVVYTFNNVVIYDEYSAIIIGNNNLILATINGGYNWYFLNFDQETQSLYDFKKMVITIDPQITSNIILYIYGKSSTNDSFLKCYLDKQIDNTYIQPYYEKNITNIIINSYDIYFNNFDYTLSKAYFATTTGIWYIDLYNNSEADFRNNNFTQITDPLLNFNIIKIIDTKLIAISDNIICIANISYNLGISTFELYSIPYVLNQFYFYDDLNFLSVSSNKQLVFSVDGGITWKDVPNYIYNCSFS